MVVPAAGPAAVVAGAGRPGPRVPGKLAAVLIALALAAAACGEDDAPGMPAATDAATIRMDAAARDVAAAPAIDAASSAPDAASTSDVATPPVDTALEAPGADLPANPDQAAPAACQACATWASPQSLGRITSPGLDALSGMAASWRNPGVIYVHNDRNVPRFHAVNETGVVVGRFDLTGATVSDIEDMEVSRCGPGSSDTCVYVADIGNNITARTVFVIYRAVEPVVNPSAAPVQAALPAERFAFSYEDGPHNAESLLVDGATGTVFVITKEVAGSKSSVYRLESFEAGRTNRAVRVVQLPVPASDDQPATAASAHPCGLGFLLRTGNRLYEFRTPPGAPFLQAFSAAPVAIPVAVEMQGEAVTYRADGRAYYTTSEGASPPLHRTLCQ